MSQHHDLCNLLVDLRDARFAPPALSAALKEIERGGFTIERSGSASDRVLAWIDDEFGGSWSSEAFAASNFVARHRDELAGFVSFGAQDLRFSWLRGYGHRKDTGIFGPFGVAKAFRGSAIGPNLLIAALAALLEQGSAFALIPCVNDPGLIAYYIKHTGAHVIERFDRAVWHAHKYRTTVLASGNGSNFQAVVDAVKDGRLPLHLSALLSNNSQAYALERAEMAGVAQVATIGWVREKETRAAYDERLLTAVEKSEPELVLLLGWMHLLATPFLERFPSVINIHPAFLPLDQSRERVGLPDGREIPAFRGAHAVRDALSAGSRWVGATVHLVSPDTDRGPVLMRKPLSIAPKDTEAAVMQHLHPIEHRVLVGGIMRWIFER
ncbi:MAG: GNAT family N-acetyltransferase [Candidatus Baltobacteraceae bacterium]